MEKKKKRSEETWEHTIENITKQPGKKGTTTTIKQCDNQSTRDSNRI